MDWSWPAWILSVVAVVVSGATACLEGNWRRRPGLVMGFANHGGMWGDLLLLPIANAALVPYLAGGPWLVSAVILAAIGSVAVHIYWYRGCDVTAKHSPEHMWPARPRGSWHGDLSIAGWLHVLYVAAELTLLVGFLVHPMPLPVVLVVCAIFTIHVPIGLLQPRWYVTRRVATLKQQPLLLLSLAALWIIAAIKTGVAAAAR